jgi:hypothetical protein
MQLSKKSMGEVAGELGIRGLYKGVAATLSRYGMKFLVSEICLNFPKMGKFQKGSKKWKILEIFYCRLSEILPNFV